MPDETDRTALNPRVWIYWADTDWVAARVLYRKKNPRLWPPAGLLGHKALEQYLKAFLRSYGSMTRWVAREGHNLIVLAKECEEFEGYFENATVRQRLQVFWEIYQSWEYPKVVTSLRVTGNSSIEEVSQFFARMETSFMAGNHLTILDELVAGIRPRINYAKLDAHDGNILTYFPSQFSRFYGHSVEDRALVRQARADNPAFGRMEREAKKRHPPPRPIGIRRRGRSNP